jgi:hypothetical protein
MRVDELLERANPVRDNEVRLLVPQEWSDETLAAILTGSRSGRGPRPAAARRARLVVLAGLVLAVLAVPAYAIGRAVDGWLGGEPAPQSVVRNFGSYTPQLGFRPEAGKAVRVASDGGFDLFATPNDRGSYCVATSTPDGGICIVPRVAAAPLVAGIMPGDPGRADARGTLLVAGRVRDSLAVAVAFTDPDGKVVTRQLGAGGFFLAALRDPEPPANRRPYECKNGTWKTTFRALGPSGDDLLTASITLAIVPSAPPGIVCEMADGPHT